MAYCNPIGAGAVNGFAPGRNSTGIDIPAFPGPELQIIVP
jgi:hypothetical protein